MLSRRTEWPRQHFHDPNETELQYPSLKIQTGESQNAANRVAKSVKLSLKWTGNEGSSFSTLKNWVNARKAWTCKFSTWNLAFRNSKNHNCSTLTTHLKPRWRQFQQCCKWNKRFQRFRLCQNLIMHLFICFVCQ